MFIVQRLCSQKHKMSKLVKNISIFLVSFECTSHAEYFYAAFMVVFILSFFGAYELYMTKIYVKINSSFFMQ